MARSDFCTGSSYRASQDADMDVIAILLGVLMFAVLVALIYGIDAI